MRLACALLAVSLLVPVTGSIAGPTDAIRGADSSSALHCPRTTSYLANKPRLYGAQPLMPRKLTELPPATAYMAVYRHIGGCDAPLTMADYRNPRER